jgi:hypothetical protein
MSHESTLGEVESHAPLTAYPEDAAELQDIVQNVARLRRWSRFSVLWIVAAFLCVFGAISFAVNASDENYRHRWEAEAAARYVDHLEADELRSENAKLRRENVEADELRSENAKLRRENDELKRAAAESERLNVRDLHEDRFGAARSPGGGEAAENAPSGRISVADKPTGGVSSAVRSRIRSAIERCYREHLKKDASARGKVTLSFLINETGTVTLLAHDVVAPEFDECITSQTATWRFPISKNTTIVNMWLELAPPN